MNPTSTVVSIPFAGSAVPTTFVGEVLRFAAVALAYLISSMLGMAFILQPEQIAVFWPANGLALGYLLMSDRRSWWSVGLGIFVGNCTSNLVFGLPLVASSGFALVNVLEPTAMAWCFQSVRHTRFQLEKTLDILQLFAIPALVCAVTGLLGATVTTVLLGAASFWDSWKVWWIAAALGATLFTPIMVTARWPWVTLRGRWFSIRVIESTLLIVLLSSMTYGIFLSSAWNRSPLFILPYPLFPLLLWIALRTDRWVMSLAVVIVSLVAAWGTVSGQTLTSVSGISPIDRVLLVQGFVAVVSLSSLVLVTSIQEQRQQEDEVRILNRTLQDQIAAGKQIQRNLEESEQRFRAIFHSQFQFIGLMSPDGIVLEANRGTLAAAGIDPADVIGKPFWETVWWTHNPQQQERLRRAVERAAQGERSRFEATHPTPNGELMWVDFSLTPFRNEAGEVYLLIPEGRDISDRKRIEQDLAASEAILRQFVQHAPAAIAMLDPQMRYLRVSDRWLKDYHLEGQNIIGRSHYEIFPDIPERWKQIHQRVLEGFVETCSDDLFTRQDGTQEWLQWEARPWLNSTGSIGGLIFFTQVITSRKLAEAELRESQERFRGAFDFAPIGVSLAALDGRLLKVNRALCRLLGYDEAELLATDFQSLTYADDLAADLTLMQQLMAGQIPAYQMDKRYYHKQGHIVYATLAVSLVRNETGEPLYFVAQVEDVTDREMAKRELVAVNRQLRLLLDSSGEGIYGIDEQGLCTFANRAAANALGWDVSQMLGQNAHTLMHHTQTNGKLYPMEDCPILKVLATGTGCVVNEEVFWSKDGRPIPVEYGSYPLLDQDRVIGAVVLFRDITARRADEMKLRVSEERYRSVVEALAQGIVLQEADGSIQTFNDRAGEILGLTREQLARRNTHDPEWKTVRDSGDPLPSHELPSMVAVRTGQPVFDVIVGVDRAGERRWLSVNAVPLELSEASGGPAVIVSFHDVTDARRLNEQLRRSLAEKDVLLREIHHRVKNNLAVICSLFHLQASSAADDPTVQALREAIDRVRSMSLVHEQLYNSADLGAVAFGEYAELLAHRIFQTYRLPASKIAFETSIEAVSLTIEQAIPCGLILNELLTNCLKHAFHHHENGVVRLVIHLEHDQFVMRVADNGAGFHIGFDIRTAKSLGVRLVRTLTRQLHGQVDYHPTAPGTSVRVAFPLPERASYRP